MKKNKQKNKNRYIRDIAWRLSIVLLMPFTLILLVVVMPIKWILTGKYKWKPKGFHLLYNWYNAVFKYY